MFVIKNKHLLISLLFLFIISGCSGSKNYFLKPAYNTKISEASLLVIPAQQSWSSSFPNHVFGSLQGTAKVTFMSYMKPLFAEYTAYGIRVNSSTTAKPEKFKTNSLSINNYKFELISPKKNSPIGADNNSTRFILMLDQFYFKEKVTSNKSATSIGIGSGDDEVKQILYFQTKYLYWDVRKQNIVGWGIVAASEQFIKNPTGSDYFNVLSKAFKEIVEQGPLKRAS